MGHRHSPEEVGRAGRVCACDGGFVAAGAGREAGLTGDCAKKTIGRNWSSAAESQRDAARLDSLRENITKQRKSFLQGLKPVEITDFTSELKLRPPKDNEKDVPLSTWAALFALRFYKAYLSILFAGSCRFQPTCSQYSYEAIERFGVARGAWLTLKRLARCQPLSRRFGYDPVPEAWDKSEALAQDVRHSAATSHEVPT
jgi:uncharacterized protein